MFTVREDIQKYSTRQLPRREEWARSIRGVNRRGEFISLDSQRSLLLMRLFKIKPLTEEEKQQKLVELRDKMSEKRAKKAAEEAKEAKANELIRRKAGKVRTVNLFSFTPTHYSHHLSHRNQRRSKRI